MAYILVFGDSTTYGAWDYEGGGWVQRLRKFLDKKMKLHPNEFYITYNLGIDSHSTEDWLPIFEEELKTRAKIAIEYDEPIAIIIELGGNDSYFINSQQRHNVLPGEFQKRLKKLFSIVKKTTKHVFYVSPAPCNESKTIPWVGDKELTFKNAYMKEYGELAKAVCREEKVIFIDIFDKVKKTAGFASHDGLHLSSKGHQKIFEIVREVLVKNNII
jgi:lysophospholipase L1-like esterase